MPRVIVSLRAPSCTSFTLYGICYYYGSFVAAFGRLVCSLMGPCNPRGKCILNGEGHYLDT